MISVSEADRDVLRFLWVKDISKFPAEIVTLRFTRVVFRVSSSPFILNATIKHHMMNKKICNSPSTVCLDVYAVHLCR